MRCQLAASSVVISPTVQLESGTPGPLREFAGIDTGKRASMLGTIVKATRGEDSGCDADFLQPGIGVLARLPAQRPKSVSHLSYDNFEAGSVISQNPLSVTLPIALPLSAVAWAFFRFSTLIGLNVCV